MPNIAFLSLIYLLLAVPGFLVRSAYFSEEFGNSRVLLSDFLRVYICLSIEKGSEYRGFLMRGSMVGLRLTRQPKMPRQIAVNRIVVVTMLEGSNSMPPCKEGTNEKVEHERPRPMS